MKSILIAALLVTFAGTAAAEPAPPPAPVSPTSPVEDPPYQSTAFMLSLGGSLAAWSTIIIGADLDHGRNPAVPIGMVATLLAPSFGHWYAGDAFSRGLRTRLIGAGLMVGAAIPVLSCTDECSAGPVLQGALYGGLILYLVGTMDDIIAAPDAARAAQPRRSVAIAPMLRRGGSGLVVTAQF